MWHVIPLERNAFPEIYGGQRQVNHCAVASSIFRDPTRSGGRTNLFIVAMLRKRSFSGRPIPQKLQRRKNKLGNGAGGSDLVTKTTAARAHACLPAFSRTIYRAMS